MKKVSDHLISEFRAQLPTEFLEKYDRLLGPDALNNLINGYHGVLRWQRKDSTFAELNLPTESNREHVQEMLVLVNYIERYMPNLAALLNMETVRLMVLIHDIGEIITGDVTYADQSDDDAATRHQNEEAAAHKLITDGVADIAEQKRLIGLYDRYEQNKANSQKKDLEALLVKFIDIIQALNFGGNNIFPPILAKMKADGVPEAEYLGSAEGSKVNNLTADRPQRLLNQFEALFKIITRKGKTPETTAMALQELIALMKAGMKVLKNFNDSETIRAEAESISTRVGQIVIKAVPQANLPL